MKKILSLFLVLGVVVLLSQSAFSAVTTYNASAVISDGSFSFDVKLINIADSQTASAIAWNTAGITIGSSTDTWRTSLQVASMTIVNQKSATTVRIYQDNKNGNTAGYADTTGYDLGGGSKTYAGLIQQDSAGSKRFFMGWLVKPALDSNTVVSPVNSAPYDYTKGFNFKDISDWDYATTGDYNTFLKIDGYLAGIAEGGAGQYTPFTSGNLFMYFGANFKDASPSKTYATQSIKIETINE